MENLINIELDSSAVSSKQGNNSRILSHLLLNKNKIIGDIFWHNGKKYIYYAEYRAMINKRDDYVYFMCNRTWYEFPVTSNSIDHNSIAISYGAYDNYNKSDWSYKINKVQIAYSGAYEAMKLIILANKDRHMKSEIHNQIMDYNVLKDMDRSNRDENAKEDDQLMIIIDSNQFDSDKIAMLGELVGNNLNN